MSVFPQFGKINPKIAATINSRIGNNVEVSKLMPWFRISSAGHVSNEKNETVNSSTVADSFSNFADSPNAFSVHTAATIKESKGLILESIPVNNSFVTSYGGIIDKERKSGRVGTDFNGGNVYATGTDRAHRPSPTIDSLSIENGNRGLSKKARFSITCYTLAQADTVSAYFLEPGFIVMVEFGFNKTKSIAEKINLAGENGP